jgi:chaperonin cofactor prefoldin
MSSSAIQRVFPPMSDSSGNDDHEFVTYSEFRGFVAETRTGFVHVESKIEWLQSTMNIRFEAMTERFNSVDKRFDDFTANIDKRFDAMDKRFDDFTANINKRFEEFTANINKRFDDANTKSHREFVGIMLGFLSINLVIIGSVVGLIAKTG